MIDYQPLWETLKKKNIPPYRLVYCEDIALNSDTIHRIKKGKGINFGTLDDICWYLDCSVEDVIRYVPDPSRHRKK